MGGDTEYEGLLEICFSGRWGTVNGDGWSFVDAQVVCKQLEYHTIGIIIIVTTMDSITFNSQNFQMCHST